MFVAVLSLSCRCFVAHVRWLVFCAGFPSRILHATVFDIFMVAHFLGWTFLFIMFRDWWICFAMSIHFEFLEMTFQYMLPNFKEY